MYLCIVPLLVVLEFVHYILASETPTIKVKINQRISSSDEWKSVFESQLLILFCDKSQPFKHKWWIHSSLAVVQAFVVHQLMVLDPRPSLAIMHMSYKLPE